ncbi:MAG: hypothetical protein ACFFDJ_08205 [Candidatus Odinarchaeota archaeon]
MKISTTTKISLVFIVTVTFIGLALIFNPSTSAEGSAQSSSGICLHKRFIYDESMLNDAFDWTGCVYPIAGLAVTVTYTDCETMPSATFYTDADGWIHVCGLLEGDYTITWTWNGMQDSKDVFLCCNAKDHSYTNKLEPKGEDWALSFHLSPRWHLRLLF